MNEKEQILVSISCVTYNHKAYIRDCIDGFLMQKTNFRFEILIHDDASTDGTAGIIREYERKYPDLIKPIYQVENQYSQGINPGRINSNRATGKYIAYCEGDDYWTDPLKLQKQVDFLENNPEYGLVCTNVRIYNQETNVFKEAKYTESKDITYEELISDRKSKITPLTVCYRKELLSVIKNTIHEELNPPKYFTGDIYLYFNIALVSQIRCIPDVTGVYRILRESMTHSKTDKRRLIAFSSKTSNTMLYYLENHPIQNKEVVRRLKFQHTLAVCKYTIISGDYNTLRAIHLSLPYDCSVKRHLLFVFYFLCKCKLFFDLFSRIYCKYI
ncbi:MAG: glycosyltransferase [Tannerellaceae bacterium]|jgi:glycosyltransferase involved in cell wall biosynthesis|nr:glycosyltransferase [Tannerellaceae bacterium]